MPTSSIDRPNIVIFMTDQQRGATILPGRHRAHTPHVDRLMSEGVTFPRAYTVSPHCCPSRASFLSGLHPSEHGVWNNVNVANALSRGPRSGVRMWSESVAESGYRLGFTGKWHVSNTAGPADHGWEEWGVTARGSGAADRSEEEQREHAMRRQLTTLARRMRDDLGHRRPGEIIRPGYPEYVHYSVHPDAFGDQRVVDSATEFIGQAAAGEEPWMVYVGTLGPHDPYQPPQEFLDMYDVNDVELPGSFTDPMTDKPALYSRIRDRFDQLTEAEHREALRHYLAFCSYQDALFGQVHAAVAAAGQLSNTIFVYLSDHGDYAGDHGLWGKGLPSFASAYHIPLVIGGAPLDEAVHGTRSELPAMITDVGPTLLELCGVTPRHPMSGLSLADALQGTAPAARDELVFQTNGNESYGNQRIVMTPRWKLVVNYFDHDELYDLESDPEEMRNLLHRERQGRTLGTDPQSPVPADLRDVVEDLYTRLWRFAIRHGDDLTDGYIVTALGTHGPGEVARIADRASG
ncbi:sulfatase-like hydrolase/transferase [Propionibacteriaceae bacterium Y2011]